MIKRNLPTLKIHKLKYNQYNEIKDANAINDNEIYEITDAAVITDNEKASYDSHIADVDIHVTADEKAALNNQAPFIVTLIYGEDDLGKPVYTADKTFDEIESAVSSGKRVYCIDYLYNAIIPYVYCLHKESDIYCHYFSTVTNHVYCDITISSENVVTYDYGSGNKRLLPSPGLTGRVLAVNSSGYPEWIDLSKPTIITTSLLASSWDSTTKTYSFETDYPNASYDIEIALDSTATSEQAEAFNSAQIIGSATSNVVKAYGEIPAVNIPVILKAVTK